MQPRKNVRLLTKFDGDVDKTIAKLRECASRKTSRREPKAEWEGALCCLACHAFGRSHPSFADKLLRLDAMGFINAPKNIRLMHKYDGDLDKVRLHSFTRWC